MAIKLIGTTSGIEVDATKDKALLTRSSAPAFGSLGNYTMTAISGSIAATLSAAGTLFSMQWTHATNLCVIESVEVNAMVLTAITTAVPFDLEAILARSFTVADSGGTAVTLTGNNNKRRTSMGSSLMGDMRIASTGTLTAGTRTVDANAVGRVLCPTTGTAALATANAMFGVGVMAPVFRCNLMDGQYPLVLAQNEGLLIRNPLAGPATGTFSVLVRVAWTETTAYP